MPGSLLFLSVLLTACLSIFELLLCFGIMCQSWLPLNWQEYGKKLIKTWNYGIEYCEFNISRICLEDHLCFRHFVSFSTGISCLGYEDQYMQIFRYRFKKRLLDKRKDLVNRIVFYQSLIRWLCIRRLGWFCDSFIQGRI